MRAPTIPVVLVEEVRSVVRHDPAREEFVTARLPVRVEEREVRLHEVAVLRRLGGGLDRALLVGDLLQRVVDVGVGRLALERLDLETLNLRELEHRRDRPGDDPVDRRPGSLMPIGD